MEGRSATLLVYSPLSEPDDDEPEELALGFDDSLAPEASELGFEPEKPPGVPTPR